MYIDFFANSDFNLDNLYPESFTFANSRYYSLTEYSYESRRSKVPDRVTSRQDSVRSLQVHEFCNFEEFFARLQEVRFWLFILRFDLKIFSIIIDGMNSLDIAMPWWRTCRSTSKDLTGFIITTIQPASAANLLQSRSRNVPNWTMRWTCSLNSAQICEF